MLRPLVVLTGLMLASFTAVFAQTLGFSYQGRLNINGAPANGNYDFFFRTYSVATGGSHTASQTAVNIPVTNGLFTTILTLPPSTWNGQVYLQVDVRPAGQGSFTPLLPRVEITSAPFSIVAQRVPWSGIQNVPPGFADGVDNGVTIPLNTVVNTPNTPLAITQNGPGAVASFRQGNPANFAFAQMLENVAGGGLEIIANGGSNNTQGLRVRKTGPADAVEITQQGEGRSIVAVNTLANQVPVALFQHQGNSNGVEGVSAGGIGVYGVSARGRAGYFYTSDPCSLSPSLEVFAAADNAFGTVLRGRSRHHHALYVENLTTGRNAALFNGNVDVGRALTQASSVIRVDHPINPQAQFLQHSVVASPDMMNVYNGNVTTDANGVATVQLPPYFEAFNQDFRYQLTVLDANNFAMARVSQEIANHQFVIRTSLPNVKVSWQVTGVRKDPYAAQNRVQPVVNKPASQVDYYVYPEGYSQPANREIGRSPFPTVDCDN